MWGCTRVGELATSWDAMWQSWEQVKKRSIFFFKDKGRRSGEEGENRGHSCFNVYGKRVVNVFYLFNIFCFFY